MKMTTVTSNMITIDTTTTTMPMMTTKLPTKINWLPSMTTITILSTMSRSNSTSLFPQFYSLAVSLLFT